MITLIDPGSEPPGQANRRAVELLKDAGWTTLSISAALVLLPIIAVDEVLRALMPSNKRNGHVY